MNTKFFMSISSTMIMDITKDTRGFRTLFISDAHIHLYSPVYDLCSLICDILYILEDKRKILVLLLFVRYTNIIFFNNSLCTHVK